MVKNIETSKANEELNLINTSEELSELKDEINHGIELYELWQYNSEWNFQIKESIKWEDENWKYIIVRWEKYYENITNWLWYLIGKDTISGFDHVYLWNFGDNWLEWSWIEFSKSFVFDWEWNNWFPVDWVLTKFNEDWSIKSTYIWKIDINYKFQWKWYIEFPPEEGKSKWCSYRWDFVNWKYEWFWIYTYEETWEIYEWNWKNWKREWKWKYTYSNWATYEWNWKNWKKEWEWTMIYLDSWWKPLKTYKWERTNNKPQEWEWTIEYADGRTYKWYILINKHWIPGPFYEIYHDLWEDNLENWEINSLSLDKNMEWKLIENWREHLYKLTKWSVSEEWNNFITLYGDKKPNQKWDDERWDIRYEINYSSCPKIEYKLDSRKQHIERELNWNQYQFKNKKWDILSIQKSSNFWDKAALHTANLINKLIYEFNKNKNMYTRFDDSIGGEDLCFKELFAVGLWFIEMNRTTALSTVQQHFWWITAEELAARLNGQLLEKSGKTKRPLIYPI